MKVKRAVACFFIAPASPFQTGAVRCRSATALHSSQQNSGMVVGGAVGFAPEAVCKEFERGKILSKSEQNPRFSTVFSVVFIPFCIEPLPLVRMLTGVAAKNLRFKIRLRSRILFRFSMFGCQEA